MRHTERNRRLAADQERAALAKLEETALTRRDDECRALVRTEHEESRALARRDEPIPADDPSLHATLDTPVQGDAGSMLAPGSLQGVSSRSSLGRAVMPRDGRRLIALVTRMQGPSRVTLVARRAIVTAGQFRIAIVARGQS